MHFASPKIANFNKSKKQFLRNEPRQSYASINVFLLTVHPQRLMKTTFYTLTALIAFAGNSILCRLALGDKHIDASSFTIIRLISGIATLFLILAITNRKENSRSKGSWLTALYLFMYAAMFSFAYVTLETGVGALILFASVQISMIGITLYRGTKLLTIEWTGIIAALLGFGYLLLPGSTAPPVSGFILMVIAGISWALYTLAGQQSINPLADTSFNFLKTLPFVAILSLVMFNQSQLNSQGVILAIISGAITSGLGYAIWYSAVKGLSGVQAAVVQLLVPILATFGGVLFAQETITERLIVSTLLILGGILLVIIGKHLSSLQISNKSTD